MRIASATAFNNMVTQIQNMDAQQSALQEEVSSGQAVTEPSDNPSVMNTVMNLVSENRQLTQYSSNASTALEISQASYAGLSQLKNLTDQVNELATQANDGTDSSSQLASFGTSVNQLIEEAVQMGNTQYNNNYLYAGTATSTPPFTATRDSAGNITGVTYAGNSQQAQIPVSSTANISPSTSGTTNSGIADLINQMVTLRDAMNSNNTSTIATSAASLVTGEDTVISAVAENGAIQTRITTEQSQQTSLSTSLATIISDKASADLPSTLVKLNQVQTAYQAVLESSARIMQSSLLDYISTS